ncbi:hypothetical protein MIR68_008267 [Amoeboaphelidium protococcarum]|nr:hypothetical protein MIR68_008267 [Amoeboaphelidium protococcarum]
MSEQSSTGQQQSQQTQSPSLEGLLSLLDSLGYHALAECFKRDHLLYDFFCTFSIDQWKVLLRQYNADLTLAQKLFDYFHNNSNGMKQSLSDEELVKRMNMSNRDGVVEYIKIRFEKEVGESWTPPVDVQFKSNGLESGLEKRVTSDVYEKFDGLDDVKIALAVSGAGKTRLLLELLYQYGGYYFTLDPLSGGIGSGDLRHCSLLAGRFTGTYGTDMSRKLIQLLYFVRIHVCKLLIEQYGVNCHPQLLLCQMHPQDYFAGKDVFFLIYEKLAILMLNGKRIYTQYVDADVVLFAECDSYPILAIDEIQRALDGEFVHLLPNSANVRPFFSSLIYQTKALGGFRNLVVAGTGINFDFMDEFLSSATFKNTALSYQLITNFKPLSQHEVKSYARWYLNYHRCDNVESVVQRVGDFKLCHGRARFIAYILDEYLRLQDIEQVLAAFMSGITQVESPIFPLNYFVQIMKAEKDPLMRHLGNETMYSLLSNALFSYVLIGRARMILQQSEVSEIVRCGLGFVVSGQLGSLTSVDILEDAVIECLRYFIPFSSIVYELSKQVGMLPQPDTAVGYMIEYFVAFALVANFAGDTALLQRLNVCSHSIDSYLVQTNNSDGSSVFFPDHMMGPDIIYRCAAQKIVYIVQVKFVNQISKQELANAWHTTDVNKFYCKRGTCEVLNGFSGSRQELLSSIKYVQQFGYKIKRLLVVHSGQNIPNSDGDDDNVTIISKTSAPNFFSAIGDLDVWRLLDCQEDSTFKSRIDTLKV